MSEINFFSLSKNFQVNSAIENGLFHSQTIIDKLLNSCKEIKLMLYMRFFTLGWVKVVKIRHKNPTKNKIANLDSRKDFA